jgi:hypothetical protein
MQVNNFLEEEKGAVDLITIVVLIGIAIVLAVVFRDKMKEILNTLLGNIQSSATSAIGN